MMLTPPKSPSSLDGVDVIGTLLGIAERFGDTVEGGLDQRPDHLFILRTGKLKVKVHGFPVFGHQLFFSHPDLGVFQPQALSLRTQSASVMAILQE